MGLLGPGNCDIKALRHTSIWPTRNGAQHRFCPTHTLLFLGYDEGYLLDEEGWYSITPEVIAAQIAEWCRCDVVLDAASAVTQSPLRGPENAVCSIFPPVHPYVVIFYLTPSQVIALDTSPTRLVLTCHNAALYGLAAQIEFVLAEFRTFTHCLRTPHPQLVHRPTPGAVPEYSLAQTQPESVTELFRLSRLLSQC
jgi:trimethylguanosine synthase